MPKSPPPRKPYNMAKNFIYFLSPFWASLWFELWAPRNPWRSGWRLGHSTCKTGGNAKQQNMILSGESLATVCIRLRENAKKKYRKHVEKTSKTWFFLLVNFLIFPIQKIPKYGFQTLLLGPETLRKKCWVGFEILPKSMFFKFFLKNKVRNFVIGKFFRFFLFETV